MEQSDNTLFFARDLTGKKLGTCLLEKMIGRGGMGEVYLAHQERPERRVAVKTLRAHPSMDAEIIQQFRVRFQREADMIARLDHINIMPIYEYGEQAGIGYLVMPYLTGGSLCDLLQKQDVLSSSQALTYLEQAAKALDYAHGQGIIHRDLKPANFLLHADGRLVLADFGIGRILATDDQDSGGAALTGTGMLLGTPEYMAPEMVRGEVLDKRVDIYELGIVLYQMLSGSVPFKGNTPLVVAAMQLQQSLPSLHASNPTIPPAIDAVLQVATAKEPAERFETAGAMAQAFRAAIVSSNVSPSFTTINALPLSTQRSVLSAKFARTQETLAPMNTPPDASLRTARRQSHLQPWFILFSIFVIAILIVGGILIGLQLSHNNFNSTSNHQPGLGGTPTTGRATSVPSPTSMPVQGMPKGTALYTTNTLGLSSTNTSCDGGDEQWTDYNSPSVTCRTGNVIIHNPQQALAGIILVALPNNAYYPSNYVIEAQMQEDDSSQADFGLYFRNQPGNVQGIYAFLIHSDGSWASYVYDDNTGAPTQIGNGSAGVYAHAQLALGVVVNGSNYTFYVNGQQVGQAHDTSYQSGTVGVVLDAGGTIDVSSFALYNLS